MAARSAAVPMPTTNVPAPMAAEIEPMTSPRRRGSTEAVAIAGAVIQMPAPARPARASPPNSGASPLATLSRARPAAPMASPARMMLTGSRRGATAATITTPSR